MLIRALPILLLIGCADADSPTGGEPAGEGEGEGEAAGPQDGGEEGEGEGEGEAPPDPGPGLPDLFDTECDPSADDPCGHEAFACVRVAMGGRAGACLQKCGPVDQGGCDAPAGCPDGTACINVRHFPVIAVNVCSPICNDNDDPVCFTGTAACAPEVEADEDLKFRCEDEQGASRYVCLP